MGTRHNPGTKAREVELGDRFMDMTVEGVRVVHVVGFDAEGRATCKVDGKRGKVSISVRRLCPPWYEWIGREAPTRKRGAPPAARGFLPPRRKPRVDGAR